MIPFCFKQDLNGDIDLSFKFTTTLQEYVGLRLQENLSFFLGEWFLDTRQGLPYFKKVIGQRFDPAVLDSVFRKTALLTAGVATVDAMQFSFNRRTRVLSLPVFRVTLKDGSKINQGDLQLPMIVTTKDSANTTRSIDIQGS